MSKNWVNKSIWLIKTILAHEILSSTWGNDFTIEIGADIWHHTCPIDLWTWACMIQTNYRIPWWKMNVNALDTYYANYSKKLEIEGTHAQPHEMKWSPNGARNTHQIPLFLFLFFSVLWLFQYFCAAELICLTSRFTTCWASKQCGDVVWPIG